MAFTVKNSKYLCTLKLAKRAPRKYFHQSNAFYKKSAVCVLWSHTDQQTHAYSTCCNRARLLSLSNGQLSQILVLSGAVHPQRFISTESTEKKLEHLSSIGNESTSFAGGQVQSGSAKVLFVEAPQLSDAATDIIDKAGVIEQSSSEATASVDLSSGVASSTADTLVSSGSSGVVSEAASAGGEILSTAADLAEPSLASLGLASSWTPVGLVQQLLEIMHVNSYMPMPWWGAIVLGTVIARVLMFPIFIKTQRNASKFAYVMPQLNALQMKFNHARRSGNSYEAMKCANEIGSFMKKHNVNPVKNTLLPMSQVPVFLSYFLALRSMAKLPVESMKVGGFSWITDLTIPDPYYIMPLCACSTLYIVLRIGAESGVRMENMKYARYFLSAVPVLLFPFCMNFPSAVLFYWCTNNFLTLGLVLLLKIDRLREYFGVPRLVKPDPSGLPEKKGFVAGIKEAFEDQRALRDLDDRRRVDEVRFRKAGTGPIPRTYSYDPTKPRPADAAAAAAKMHSKTKS